MLPNIINITPVNTLILVLQMNYETAAINTSRMNYNLPKVEK